MYSLGSSRNSTVHESNCTVYVGNEICGESGTLQINKEFKKLFEEKLQKIDGGAGDDCLKEKLKLQEEWIENLTQQNELLIQVIHELEYQATDRVQALEEKLQQSAQCLCEAEKRIQDKERTIHELQQKVHYFSSFGDVQCMAKELKCKNEECESLKQVLVEKSERSGEIKVEKKYVEEIEAQLKDFLKARKCFKRKAKSLEKKNKEYLDQNGTLACECERLKIEIQRLIDEKQKLHEEMESTKEKLQNNTNCQMVDYENRIESLSEAKKKAVEELVLLNEENRNLSETISNLRKREERTISLMRSEISKLNSTIEELHANLERTKLVQDEEEKVRKIQIIQLNETIYNLEDRLKEALCKDSREKLKCKICKGKSKVSFVESVQVQAELTNGHREMSQFTQITSDGSYHRGPEVEKTTTEMEQLKAKVIQLEGALNFCEERAATLQEMFWLQTKDYEHLQDLSVSLEIEHCNNLQSAELLECQRNNYKQLLQNIERENTQYKDQIRKLAKQKKCYEELVIYFKNEIGIMADQLSNLQELLTLSSESAQHESQKFMQAFVEVQNLNEKLSSQLCGCQQQFEQGNQLHENKICELNRIIREKECELSKHDQEIVYIRQKLQCTLKQNEEFQSTIYQLNTTILELQQAIKTYELENCAIRRCTQECQEKINGYFGVLDGLKTNLKEKTAQCLNFEKAYNNEKSCLCATRKELEDCQKKLKCSQFNILDAVGQLKEKLAASEESNNKLCEEYEKLQKHLANITRKEAVKDQEIKRYRKIVGDLKKTMMELNSELNKSVALKDMNCKNENCRCTPKDKAKNKGICSCPCEIEFYQKMIEILKKSVCELKEKLSKTQQMNKQMEEGIRLKDVEIGNLRNALESKEAELVQCTNRINKLNQDLEATKQNEAKYANMVKKMETEVNQLRQELEVRTFQLNEDQRKAQEINSSKCVQLVCAKDEINDLKEEIAGLLMKQCGFSKEVERLQAQNAQLQCTIKCMREKSGKLQIQIEQYAMELENLNSDKNALLCENKELLDKLKSLQSSYYCVNKQQRDLQNIRSKHIEMNKSQCPKASKRPQCSSPCSLGSQGATSVYDPDSLPTSPCADYMCDWYSATFRSESDNESDEEDYCVNKLRNMTNKMKKSNKMWSDQSKACDYGVSSDKK